MSSIELIPAKAAAEQLGLKSQTLATWRLTGRGPRFVKVGSRVMYRLSDVEAWIERQVRASTSDHRKSA